jgi:hypothetical protein
MPTFLEYAFFEGSRASTSIQPVAILVGILASFLVLLMDMESFMAWRDGAGGQGYKQQENRP